jgi:uncharacterized membrane protein
MVGVFVPFLMVYLTSALIAIVAIPLILRKVPPNGLYGFRTPKTLSSSEIWYEANRMSGIYLFWASVVAMFADGMLQMAFGSWNPAKLLTLLMSINFGTLMAAVGMSLAYLRKL